MINEPAHEIMVLITLATSEGSGEPAHPHLHLKNEFIEDEKYHDLMRWLKYNNCGEGFQFNFDVKMATSAYVFSISA